jgi:hypothetical protein
MKMITGVPSLLMVANLNLHLNVPLASAASAAAQESHNKWWGDYELETPVRGPRFFNPPPPRKAGFTYNDDFRMELKGTLDTGMGMTMQGSFDFDVDVESKIQQGDDGIGSLKVEMTMENLVTNLNGVMFHLHCDSNDPKNSDHPDCDELLALVGSKETVETDANGDVVRITTFDGITLNAEQLGLNDSNNDNDSNNQGSPELTPPNGGDTTLDGKFQAQQFAASMHFDKHQEIVKLLPDHAVNPGDSWIDNVDMNGLGVFKGTSYLKGYTTDYKDGSDVAVFYFEGSLHLDMSAVAQLLGQNDDPEDPDIAASLPKSMTDAKITTAIFWDVEDEMPRWVQANVTTTLEIANPMAEDDADESTMQVPLELQFDLASDILVRPPPPTAAEAAAAAAESTTPKDTTATSSAALSSTATERDETMNKSSGGGRFFVVVLMVAAALGGAYYVHQKRQEDNNAAFYNRPANNAPHYEFSNLGGESMA